MMMVSMGAGLCLVLGDCHIVVLASKKQIQMSLEFLMILNDLQIYISSNSCNILLLEV